MCVGSVCKYPSYNDTNPPSGSSPFSNQAVLRFLSEWRSSAQTAPTIADWQGRLTLDPPWVSWELSASVAGEDKMSPIKRSRCLVVGCNNEYSSRHLLPTSEPLKTQRINLTFVLKWMRRSPICLNASMSVVLNPHVARHESKCGPVPNIIEKCISILQFILVFTLIKTFT